MISRDIKSMYREENLQFNECIGSFKRSVLDRWYLIPSQINFNQIRKIPESSIRFDSHNFVII